ncbi:lytic transglycosylase domain-containing protein [Allofrancisella guangzhouensis]|uniref:Lytic murein transglycosylase n=1 Tax=Allofrancisella guangzhouensis TaxID=594679 RepID=A0A0A8E5K5_9GAMM|nr:lytic transglycosylase domain-containing protein [Allofrancisella guangzhouensis]AJC49288.1 lytic murein transglycosylase [Allofrancisella guangzhouensis]MBK2027185.1 lytic transglycosylase domain-containing protein [Allofrancisella guangzhouensis]MBK2044621.1 lytic transglycosylase domain-containing protein [Allofrancisella guangzhouensis]MBK2045096.1 lytic transglycosylase domain-containing protein [Allofrancisella guangzhouensis]
MFKKKYITFFIIILCSVSIAYSLTKDQIQYSQQALKALEKKDYKSYYYLKSNLKDTSIYPYLQYKEISLEPSIFDQVTIDSYYNSNKDTYWLSQLSDNLATYYAKNHNWELFDKYYNGGLGVAGKCWSMQAQYEQGSKEKALNAYAQLWQNRVYMPSSCNEMQKYWDNYEHKAKDYIINKAYTLSFVGKFKDALWLLNTYVKNNEDYVNYITTWKQATVDPSKLDSFISKFHKYRNFNSIFVEISKGLIKKDLESYVKVWDSLKNKKYLSDKTKHQCISEVAISFARAQSPKAKQWLAKVDEKYLDTIFWEWLLRVDLYNGDFKGYLKTYSKLPKGSQQDDAWRYWLAYSYKQVGQEEKANQMFEQLATKPLEYYSFLAADELGKSYNYGDKPYDKLDNQNMNILLKDQTIQQAVDLYQIKQYTDSTGLWKWVIRNKLKNNQKDEIKKLAQLAANENMYYAAIFNMAVIGQYTNTDLLFPKAFISEVNKNADKYAIDKDLIFSIMRKESLFDIEAGSSAGAKGLMQVTIPTAEFIVKKYKLALVGDKTDSIDKQIFTPENNIKIGTANLFFLEGLFNKNIILSIAAYNAGPGNVAKWLNTKEVSAPIWIENIPFGETRHYVRKVLVYMIVYNNFVFKDKQQHISDFLGSKLSHKLSFR